MMRGAGCVTGMAPQMMFGNAWESWPSGPRPADRGVYFMPPFGVSDRRGRLTSSFRRFLRTGS